jgi:GntR family transcriptional regulator
MYKLDYDSSIPLFEQIEQKTRFAIATGEFPEGKIIPAVLEVARAATINHLTVFKAYRHLTDEGLLSPTRGVGFLVVEGAKRRCEKFRQEFFVKRLEDTLNDGKSGGLSLEKMREMFEIALERVATTTAQTNNSQPGTENDKNE